MTLDARLCLNPIIDVGTDLEKEGWLSEEESKKRIAQATFNCDMMKAMAELRAWAVVRTKR